MQPEKTISRLNSRNKVPKLVIQNRQKQIKPGSSLRKSFRQAAALTLAEIPLLAGRETEISLLLCDNLFIKDLNREYRDKDLPTDVLSFPQFAEIMEITQGEHAVLLGDIVISLEKAQEQAELFGHSFEREAVFLFIHGLLHLLGYDHELPEDEAVMIAAQKRLICEIFHQQCKEELNA